LTDVTQVQQRWKEYIVELYDKEVKPEEKEAHSDKIVEEDTHTINTI